MSTPTLLHRELDPELEERIDEALLVLTDVDRSKADSGHDLLHGSTIGDRR